MTSLRNNPSKEDRLLDAARASILSVGWKRTTLTDVARRAGMSRMTVYRTQQDMTTLLSDLLTREWLGMMTDLLAGESAGDWPDRIAGRVVGMIRAIRANPLFQRIVDVDPELLLPYLLDRRGRSQQALVEMLVATITEAQADGAIRGGDPQVLARTLLLTAHGFALSHQTMTDDGVTTEALDAELADLVRRYLAP